MFSAKQSTTSSNFFPNPYCLTDKPPHHSLSLRLDTHAGFLSLFSQMVYFFLSKPLTLHHGQRALWFAYCFPNLSNFISNALQPPSPQPFPEIRHPRWIPSLFSPMVYIFLSKPLTLLSIVYYFPNLSKSLVIFINPVAVALSESRHPCLTPFLIFHNGIYSLSKPLAILHLSQTFKEFYCFPNLSNSIWYALYLKAAIPLPPFLAPNP